MMDFLTPKIIAGVVFVVLGLVALVIFKRGLWLPLPDEVPAEFETDPQYHQRETG